MTPKVYFSHPILGSDIQDTRWRVAELTLDYASKVEPCVPYRPLEIILPEHNTPCPADNASSKDMPHTFCCYLKADLLMMLQCHKIVLCPGWSASRGCRLELEVALHCGLEVIECVVEYGVSSFRKLDPRA